MDRITRGTKKPEPKVAEVCDEYLKLHEAYQVQNSFIKCQQCLCRERLDSQWHASAASFPPSDVILAQLA